MIAEERERAEGADVEPKLVQKLESYLRAHFDGESAGLAGDALERLLRQVGADWLMNRGLQAGGGLLDRSVSEAIARYRANWDGKVQGEDDRSRAFGRALAPGTKGYTA